MILLEKIVLNAGNNRTKAIKFVIAGGTSAGISVAALFLLTNFLHVWYLFSSLIAFVPAFAVSFLLQKFWTFGDNSMLAIKKQLLSYFVIVVSNPLLNTPLLYLFVEFAHFHYIVAQIIVGAVIAVMSYFLYQRYVFNVISSKK